jgi:ABC-type proline/glycine betaine transport system ATPase subunit
MTAISIKAVSKRYRDGMLAVMRDGVLQQVGEPDELYNSPRNLFVPQTGERVGAERSPALV